MKAAVVTRYGDVPEYVDVAAPTVSGEHEAIVDVVAAALSPRVRSQAAGTHYTSTDDLPLIPGIDGVGRLTTGELVYFLLPDTNKGSMAQHVAIDMRRSVLLPQDADAVQIAAVMNPAMASWVALRQRMQFQRGQNVLILGATGNAGRCAVQVARRLGADDVVAVGRRIQRRQEELIKLGATRVIELDTDSDTLGRELGDAGKDVEVVLDFLWGEPTKRALYAIVPNRSRDAQLLTWIQIGSVAGPESPIPSAALRAVNLTLIGSGQGSVDGRAYRAEIETLAREIHAGAFDVAARAVPLREVKTAWLRSDSAERIVFVP